jgi:hypothetical protein
MASIGLFEMIGPLLSALPLAIALFVGLGLAVSRHTRHPRASLYAAGGFALALLQIVASLGFQYWLRQTASGGGLAGFSGTMIGYNIIHVLLSLASWACLITAIFIDRPASPRA